MIDSVYAIRAGIKDAKAGRPAYLWSAFTNAAHRKELLRGGWKDIQLPYLAVDASQRRTGRKYYYGRFNHLHHLIWRH